MDVFPPKKFQPIGVYDNVTSCCVKHQYSIKHFLETNNYNEQNLLKFIKDVPLNFIDNEMEHQYKFATILETKGNLYKVDNISDEGKIRFICIPVIYTLRYN